MIKNTEVILFPTDTVYGIGVRPNKKGLERLYKIKKRDKNKKIVALVSNKEKAKEILEENILVYALIDEFFPGELTIISKAKKDFLNLLGYSDDIGVRLPNNKKALDIIEKFGGILMTSSANISGNNPSVRFSEIPLEIIEQVDLSIIDDEGLSGLSSTIVKIIDDDISLIRTGNFEIEKIYKFKEDILEK